MQTIQLTQGKSTLVDDENFNYLNLFKWYYSRGYAFRKLNRKHIALHRFLLNPPKNKEVDHINGDRLDNRQENLRICDKADNCLNRGLKSDNTSGFKGVSWNKEKNKFEARIQKYGKRLHLGLFDRAEEAAKAYNEVVSLLFKDFNRNLKEV